MVTVSGGDKLLPPEHPLRSPTPLPANARAGRAAATDAPHTRRAVASEAGAAAATRPGELWWQLYVMSDRKQSEERIRGAVEGGAKAIVVTVDVVAMGNREADAAPAAAKSWRPVNSSEWVAATSASTEVGQ